MTRDFITRRSVLLHSAALGAMSALPGGSSRAQAPAASSAPKEFVEVDTLEGRLRGQRQNGICLFKGVRYAQPPVGKLRFKSPEPLAKWQGTRDALNFGHPALQVKGQVYGVNEPAPDEDCLVLNIWTPEVYDGKRRPVMFYCHGGGFVTGSGASQMQDGSNLARDNDVVVVETNHRLGIMGYLYLGELLGAEYESSANAGMQDIVEALRWTHRNIEAFGGDPANVMVSGESGGGAKTSCIYVMPSAAPYFHKASIESGPGVRMSPRDTAVQTSHWVLQKLGLSPNDAHKLLQVPAEQLLQVQLNPPPTASLGLTGGRRGIGASGVGGFGPLVDGHIIPAHPFDPVAPAISADKPLMVGSNRDEVVFFYLQSGDKSIFTLDEAGLARRMTDRFGANGAKLLAAYRQDRPDASPSQVAVAIETAGFAGAGSIAIAERKVAQGRAPVFMYLMTDHMGARVPGTDYPVGAMHAMDIRLKFKNLAQTEARMPSLTPEERADHERAAQNMSQMWATFARTGQPAASGQPAWPAYDLKTRATMMIEARCHVANDPYPAERKVWAELESGA